MTRCHSKIIVSGVFICILLVTHLHSASAESFGRPRAAEGPTQVTVAVYVIDIDEVNNAGQSFDANVYVKLHWLDPRLAHSGPTEIMRPLTDVWNPRLQFVNQQKLFSTFPEVVAIYPDGRMAYQQRVWGSFSQPLKLKDFPFDKQTLSIQLVAAGYGRHEIELVQDPESLTGIASNFSLADWNILDWSLSTAPFVPSIEAELPGLLLSIEVERKYGYFVTKVILPLVLIVMMSWVVFWIDPKESGTQIGVAVTTMLTLIAYRFAVGADLPKISYLTRVDYFILGSTFLVFASLIEVVVTATYAKSGHIERAQAIDRWARVLFPAVFIALSLESLVLKWG